jgi:hypothetical protein
MDTFLQIDTSHRELLVKTAKRVLETEKGNVNMAKKIYNLSRSSKLTEQQRESLIALVRISRLAMDNGMTNEITVYSNNHKILTISFGKEFPNQFFISETTETQVEKELSLWFEDYKDYLLDLFTTHEFVFNEIWVKFDSKRKPVFKDNTLLW